MTDRPGKLIYDPVQHQISVLERIADALEYLADHLVNKIIDDGQSLATLALPRMCAVDCGCAGGQPADICNFRPSCTRCAPPPKSASEPTTPLDDWHEQAAEYDERFEKPRNFLELDDCS